MRKTPPRHGPDGTLGDRLSRSEVAEVLGVSYARVCDLQKHNKLLGHRDPETGRYQFECAIVYKLAAQRAERAIDGTKRGSVAELDGRLVARIFEYFKLGWSLVDVVCKEQLSPAVVRGLYREYKTPLGERSPPWHIARRGRPISLRSVKVTETSEAPGTVIETLKAAAAGGGRERPQYP